MEKIIWEDQTYYINKGMVYDASFLEVTKEQARAVLACHCKTIDYTTFDESKLLTYLRKLKNAELYDVCLEVVFCGLNTFSDSVSFYTASFPIITSCYRAKGQPQQAIDFWMQNKKLFASCLSVPLLTSLAAAYCDVGNYELAKKCANRAYAIQGGSLNYSTELSLVYRRIKKEYDDGTLI